MIAHNFKTVYFLRKQTDIIGSEYKFHLKGFHVGFAVDKKIPLQNPENELEIPIKYYYREKPLIVTLTMHPL